MPDRTEAVPVSTTPDPSARKTVVAVVLTLAALELVRTAWIGDDAAITLRSVLNVMHGYGATFNIDERVQTYTHPLWFLLIAATTEVTRNVFASTFALSFALSLAVIALVMARIADRFEAGVLAACVLLVSKAYVDFAASGLEHPLCNLILLLVILFAMRATARTDGGAARWFFLSCSLLYLSRPDEALVAAPLALLVVSRYRREPGTLLSALSIGALPAIAWTIFSLYYYGFPFPNTAYAKLGAGIPLDERMIQGGIYLLDSLRRDRVTLPFIVAMTVLALRSSAFDRMLALGGLLYLAYVVSIGGDFMSGRFLVAPLLMSVCVLARARISLRLLRGVCAGVGLLALTNLGTTLLSGPAYADTRVDDNGIADERGYYFQRYGLVAAPLSTFREPAWNRGPQSVIVLCANLGYTGIEQGPGTHIIDICALADPLLARLPAERTRRWRIGHFTRQLPTDYEESVRRGVNRLADDRTRAYYESIRVITRGDLNDVARWREVVRMNRGLVPAPDWRMYYETKVPPASITATAISDPSSDRR